MPESLPPRGINFNNLTLAGSVGLGPNSHGVSQATLKDSGLKGFFKPVSDKTYYPASLAKWSVANSLMYRLYMGNDAAEERLVFYENGDIAGTFSVAAPNAKPLLFAGESESDSLLNHYRNPSAETMIQLNMTQLLVTSWAQKEDDLHPAQILFCYDGIDELHHYINPRYVRIDFDMSNYPKTGEIKGYRWVDGNWREVADKNMRFTKSDVTYFPNLTDGPYYWPTKTGVLGYKESKNVSSFQTLPDTKILHKTGEPTSFKLQKFEAILRQLLLFQPNATRLRLKQYFSENTDGKFIEEVLDHAQTNFDEFYLATVFYRGDEKTNDPAFKDFLRRRPSAYKKVVEFAKQINLQLEKEDLPGAFNLTEIEQKYHQIWRDSYWPQFNDIRLRAFKFYQNLGKLVSVSVEESAKSPLFSDISETSGKVTRAMDLFPSLSVSSIKEIKIMCDANSPLRPAFETCHKVIPELIKEIESYFEVLTPKLTVEDNTKLVKQLESAGKSLIPLLEKLGEGTETIENLRALLRLMNETTVDVNLSQHINLQLIGGDKPIDCQDKNGHPEATLLPYNDPTVIQDVIQVMFKWANNNKSQLHQLVKEAIELYGSTKNRSQPVKEYIQLSAESGANQLACIFSWGGWECGSSLVSTSLNMHLFNLILRKLNHSAIQPKLEELKDAYFNDALYIQKLNKFVKSDINLSHPYHDTTFPKFELAVYEWLDKQWDLKQKSGKTSPEALVFEKKLSSAVSAYNENRSVGASWFHDSSTEITKMVAEGKSYKYIFSKVIITSGQSEKSLAYKLFMQIWPEVIKANPELDILKFKLHGQEVLENLQPGAKKMEQSCKEQEDNLALQAVTKYSGKSSWW
ncbi:hypothetical protein [Legionella sp. W05-934-2]|uniref:hypothetical protein n=1 Tax=Legionella sp. W05-934-2 TaxID=1198649 RepID=UPI0034620D73